MKKKTMVLGGLMAAVAITGASVAGTYAKYSSTSTATGEAVVAKWGFKSGSETMVLTSLTDGKMAPGYSGSYIFTSNAGDHAADTTSEVPYTVTLDATVTNTIMYLDDSGAATTESPIKFALKPVTVATAGTVTDTEKQLAVQGLSDGDYTLDAAGLKSAIESGTAGSYIIAWKWLDDGAGTNDAKDTALGNAVADGATSVADMKVTVKIDTTIAQDTTKVNHKAN